MKLHRHIVIALIGLLTLSAAALAGDLAQIYICPGDMMLRAGMQQQFEVFGLDAEGNHVPVTGPVTWSTDSKSGTITSSGLFTAGLTRGMYPSGVKATVGALSAVAVIEVISPKVCGDYALEVLWGCYGPGHLNGPLGIAVRPTGVLYVGDHDNGRIQAFTTAGKYVMSWCAEGAGSYHKFNWHPMQIALDSMGNVYETDMSSFCIKKYSPIGKYMDQIGRYGSDEYGFQGAIDVAVDKNGYVYGLDYEKCQVIKFDPAGNPITHWGSQGTAPEQFTQPCALAVDGNGRVYVTDAKQNAVKIFSSTGAYIGQWNGPGLFSSPWGIEVDQTGNVYVADSAYTNGRVRKLDAQGSVLQEWYMSAEAMRGTSTFDGVVLSGSISLDGDGNIYVARYLTNSVEKLAPSGETVAIWGSQKELRGQFNSPRGIVIDAQNNMYILDNGNDRVQKFDSQRRFVAQFGSTGYGLGQFIEPYGIALSPDGKLYVADRMRRNVQVFDASGSCVQVIGFYGNYRGGFIQPTDVAIDSAGYIYVADINRGCVLKFNPQGQFITEWGSQYSSDYPFTYVSMVAVDAQDCVYVESNGDHKLRKYDADGHLLMQFGKAGLETGQVMFPYGIDFDDKGNIYVADANEVDIFDPSGNWIGELPRPTSEPVASPFHNDVALDSFNNIYTVDEFESRITKYVPRFTPTSPSQLKLIPDGQYTSFSGYIVSAGTTDMGDCFYVESPNRVAGIKVINTVAPADKAVNLEGIMTTVNGERVIKATSISVVTDASVQPVGMNLSALGGGKAGFQEGLLNYRVAESGYELVPMTGLNNVGLLVRTWGRVELVNPGAGTFVLTDGGSIKLKCKALTSVALPEDGQMISVSGISTTEKDAQGNLLPLFRVRRAEDIRVQQAN